MIPSKPSLVLCTVLNHIYIYIFNESAFKLCVKVIGSNVTTLFIYIL